MTHLVDSRGGIEVHSLTERPSKQLVFAMRSDENGQLRHEQGQLTRSGAR